MAHAKLKRNTNHKNFKIIILSVTAKAPVLDILLPLRFYHRSPMIQKLTSGHWVLFSIK